MNPRTPPPVEFDATAEVYDQYDGNDDWCGQVVEFHVDRADLKDLDGATVHVTIQRRRAS